MAKVIKLSEEMKVDIIKDFAAYMEGIKLMSGTVNFSRAVVSINQKAKIIFKTGAWIKMETLIKNFDKEVAWHGVASRVEGAENVFIISDILVYPQEVTAATVVTDQQEYENWLINLPDDQFNNLRMQGHSHVNMPVSPSATDLNHQEEILGQLDDDMFYIFMIWNKRFNSNCRIYDMKHNVMYEDKDIEVQIESCSGVNEFLEGAKKMVRDQKPQQYSGYQYGQYGQYGQCGAYNAYQQRYQPQATQNQKDQKPVAIHVPSEATTAKEEKGSNQGKDGKRKSVYSSSKETEEYLKNLYGVTDEDLADPFFTT